VGTAHTESSASQLQSRKHSLLSNGSVNTFPRRCDFWLSNPLLDGTYNKRDSSGRPLLYNDRGENTWLYMMEKQVFPPRSDHDGRTQEPRPTGKSLSAYLQPSYLQTEVRPYVLYSNSKYFCRT
jgi:hypothetical protein